MREYNFDGLVGPTHQYAGLSLGNLASTEHAGEPGNPRRAALEGLEKMRYVAALGVGQAVLPPQPRPDVGALRRLGFAGSDREVLASAARAPRLLSAVSSASAMWTANAATVAPSADTEDGRVHFTPANLISMFHRSLEARDTTRVLRAVFADEQRFVVHDPLPAADAFSDEGAANHTRLETSRARLHLFGWGRAAGVERAPRRFPARQTREASEAVARLHRLSSARTVFWQQHPDGIDAGAFHSDVLCVGAKSFFMVHELAFVDTDALVAELVQALGPELAVSIARNDELPVADAVAAYPFNSQLVTLPNEKLAIVAPTESERTPAARRFLERVVAENEIVESLHFVEVNASMRNGGGPACLRLRVWLEDAERDAVAARVFFDERLYADLRGWIERHYRDRLSVSDLADPSFKAEVERALDELTQLLRLGSVYDFQRP